MVIFFEYYILYEFQLFKIDRVTPRYYTRLRKIECLTFDLGAVSLKLKIVCSCKFSACIKVGLLKTLLHKVVQCGMF